MQIDYVLRTHLASIQEFHISAATFNYVYPAQSVGIHVFHGSEFKLKKKIEQNSHCSIVQSIWLHVGGEGRNACESDTING